MAMTEPKTQALIMEVMRSQAVTARTQELRMIQGFTSYTTSAIMQLHAMPAEHPKRP